MSAMASQISGVSIVCSTVCSGADQRKNPKLCVIGFCEGNKPVVGGFPSQRASNDIIMINLFNTTSHQASHSMKTLWHGNAFHTTNFRWGGIHWSLVDSCKEPLYGVWYCFWCYPYKRVWKNIPGFGVLRRHNAQVTSVSYMIYRYKIVEESP